MPSTLESGSYSSGRQSIQQDRWTCSISKEILRLTDAVVKRSAVVDEMMVHEGPARVFECEEDAIAAIKGGKIVEGDVVVIRYEGPKGGPGMREMLNPTSAIAGMGLGSSVALITDGRFSGASQRCIHRTRFAGSSSRRTNRSGRRRRHHQDQHSRDDTECLMYRMKNWQHVVQNGSQESQKLQQVT